MKWLKIFIILFIFLLLEASADEKKSNKDCCECPALLPPGDLNNPEDIPNLSRKFIENLWSNPEPPRTKNVQKLSKILIKLSQTNNTYWLSTAHSASLWAWAFLPQLNIAKPTLCLFSNFIDAFVKWLWTDDCKNLIEPLTNVGTSIRDGSKSMASFALANSKCLEHENKFPECQFDLTIPTDSINNASCRNNGTRYKIKKYIKEIKPYFPNKFICLLQEMYKSCEYQDNLIAAMTLISTSPPLQSAVDGFDNKMKFQHFYLQFTTELPACCCKDFCNALRINDENNASEGPRAAKAALNEIGCC